MKITYSIEPDLDPAEFADVLHRSTLGERRPMDEPDRLKKMVENADIIVCARNGEGLSVTITFPKSVFRGEEGWKEHVSL